MDEEAKSFWGKLGVLAALITAITGFLALFISPPDKPSVAPSSPQSAGFQIEKNRSYKHPKGLIRIITVEDQIIQIDTSNLMPRGALEADPKKTFGTPLHNKSCFLTSIPPREWVQLDFKYCSFLYSLKFIGREPPLLPVRVYHSYGLLYGEWLH